MTINPVVRVLLVDDHAMVRDGLKRLIDEQSDLTVIAEAGDGRQALELAQSHAPDVALVDISMPGWDGAVLTQQLTRTCPSVRIIAVTRHDDDVFVKKMLTAGAKGYVLKQSAGSELVRAVRAVARGDQYIDAAVRSAHETDSAASGHVSRRDSEPLTNVEEEVLRLIAGSWAHQRIAEHLGIELSDVLSLRSSAMQKAGLGTRMQIIHYARSRGWLDMNATRRTD